MRGIEMGVKMSHETFSGNLLRYLTISMLRLYKHDCLFNKWLFTLSGNLAAKIRANKQSFSARCDL
jgi:hypothetical protein